MSENKYSAEEILRIAVKGEEIAESFYRTLLKKTADPGLQDAARQLLEDEQKHKVIFSDILSASGADFIVQYPYGEADSYLKALARESLFSLQCAEKKVFSQKIEIKDVLDSALCMKKDAILFYTHLKGKLLSQEKTIDTVLKEEKDHFALISSLKARYVKE